MGWSDKYKKSIDCDNPKGFSQRAHCQGKKKKMSEERSGSLHHWFKGSKSKEGKPGWVQADGSPCANEPGETKTPKCFSSARLSSLKRKGKEGEAIIRAAVRRKRQEDPGQQAKSGGAKPTLVKTFAKGKKDPNYIKPEPGLNETMEINEAQRDIKGKGSGKKDACYHKVKSRYDVWPSAYASGALVKCRKVGAANWGTKSEETLIGEGQKCWPGYKKKGTKKMFGKTYNNCVKANEEMEMRRYCPKCAKVETREECRYGPKYWDMFSIPEPLSPNQKKYNIATVHPGNFPESYDHEHSMARSEISTIISAAKRLRKKMKGEGNVEAWVQSKITKAADYLDSAADYVDSGEMKAEEYSNWRADFGLSEDWQKVNRQDKTDGLSPAAVKAYRRENPGSKLQTAVTEKNPKGKRAKRRANFCRRMKGMRSKLTSAKTARDPDSRINKALRRWNCN
jgi:hypothetical protein